MRVHLIQPSKQSFGRFVARVLLDEAPFEGGFENGLAKACALICGR